MNAVDVTHEQRQQLDALAAATHNLAALIERHIEKWGPVMTDLRRTVIREVWRGERPALDAGDTDFVQRELERIGWEAPVSRLWTASDALSDLLHQRWQWEEDREPGDAF